MLNVNRKLQSRCAQTWWMVSVRRGIQTGPIAVYSKRGRKLRLLSLFAMLFALCGMAAAESPKIPNFWDLKERLPKPEITNVERLRFLTTTDFPPFNYLDPQGRLSGFHVDLARRICGELGILDKCQIQALPWSELDAAMSTGQGEALMAGLAINPETRDRYVFTRPYLEFPARFITLKASAIEEPIGKSLAGKRVGVVSGTAHEAMLRQLFPALKPVTYSQQQWLYDDMRDGKLDAAFGDGMRLSFWLAGQDAKACCKFAGGPYLAPSYFGLGLAIAVTPENAVLADAFNYALRELQAKGVFAELYLRYFPVSFY